MDNLVLFLFFSRFFKFHKISLNYFTRLDIQASFEEVHYKFCQLQLRIAFQIACFPEDLN